MTTGKRNSNFELLRICAMLMIVAYHIFVHCVNVQLTDGASIAWFNNGLFNKPETYKKLLVLTTVAPMGQIGNVIFITLSGYFMAIRNREMGCEPGAVGGGD